MIEYFGLPLYQWTENDFDIFATTFLSCREKDRSFFKSYISSYFPTVVKKATDDLKKEHLKELGNRKAEEIAKTLSKELRDVAEKARNLTITEIELTRLDEIEQEAGELQKNAYRDDVSICFSCLSNEARDIKRAYEIALRNKRERNEEAREQAAKDAARKAQLEKEAKEAADLVHKYGKIGTQTDFLLSQFRTYFGASISGDMGTVIKLYDNLDGEKKWEKKDDGWILTQKRKDKVTGAKHEILYVFYDLREKKGYVWLEKIVADKEILPADQLFYIVMELNRK